MTHVLQSNLARPGVPVFSGSGRHGEMQAALTDHRLAILRGDRLRLEMSIRPGATPGSIRCSLVPASAEPDWATVLAACEALFIQRPRLDRLVLDLEAPAALERLLDDGVVQAEADGSLLCEAEQFWQYAPLWLSRRFHGPCPLKQVMTEGKRHPLRARKVRGTLYRRFIPWLGQTLTLEMADLERDLATFNRWMNAPRVARFWEEQGDLEQHRAYLQRQLADPHSLPVIGRFDGVPFGYFEIYWAKEDRLAPFYDADDYDRGLHLLVGEENFRGKAFYTAWFSSICHFMFLDDPRTQRIVCEPRHDNHRQIANFDRSGFAKVKHFNFPHKRALLVMLSRERFFSERFYQPLAEAAPLHLQVAQEPTT